MMIAGKNGNDSSAKVWDGYLGIHVLIEMYNCSKLTEQLKSLEEVMLLTAERSGATVVNSNFHQFSPYGISGVIVIEESHFTIHTWPEHQYVAIDIFTCTPKMDIEIAISELLRLLQPARHEITRIKRGSDIG